MKPELKKLLVLNLPYVDASIHVQLSFLNRKVDPVQYAKSFEIAPQGDDFDDIRAEYTAILQKQLASGNNGIVKTKYLTFTIEADSLKTARARLTRIGLDLLGYIANYHLTPARSCPILQRRFPIVSHQGWLVLLSRFLPFEQRISFVCLRSLSGTTSF